MKLSKTRMTQEGERSVAKGSWRIWKEMVVHIFSQLESLGFKLIVPYPGHYPLIPPLEEAINDFKNEGGKSSVFVLKDQLFTIDGKEVGVAPPFDIAWRKRVPFEARLSILGLASRE